MYFKTEYAFYIEPVFLQWSFAPKHNGPKFGGLKKPFKDCFKF